MTALLKTAESLPNISIMTSTAAGKLLTQNGRVCGVTAKNAKDEVFEIYSKAVVVATGGLAPLIARESKAIEISDEMLTLSGMRILYERNR